MTALPFLLSAFAFLLFGLATDQHHGKRLRRPCPSRRRAALRAGACTCLALGFALSLGVWGAVFGPIGWAASVMSGAALAFGGLNFVPLRRPPSRQPSDFRGPPRRPATAQTISRSANSVNDPTEKSQSCAAARSGLAAPPSSIGRST
ncbi:DUF3325 domain-containing protein [Sphingomonas sp. PAMC 26605]|uniref:DUF3325 domain-containing protein n=1 Tax=Sphingomonas sp. PAMC 26605 TaxID=1112214 RepID=UPI00026CACD8|nr:DUF3325 domain-containing protein [Sphingomonas sp. PAMC 26605]